MGASCVIPVYAGLEAEVTLVLQIKVAAQISVSGGIEIKLVSGSRKVSGKPEKDLSKDPSVKLKFSIEGKATFDIIPSFSVGLKILKVFKISGEVSSDLCISATAALIDADTDTPSNDVIHNCALCIDGDVTATFSVNIKFQFGLHKKKQKTILDLQLFSASRKLGDFYISFISWDDGNFSYREFGFGECPHQVYKVTFNVVDENGKPLEKVKISDDVNTVETDSKGKAYCYYKDGTYTYTVTRDGYEIDTLKMTFETLAFVVHGDTVTVNVYMKKSDTQNDSGVLDSGTCGKSLTWTLYNDGELVISGAGNMYNWTDSADVPWYSKGAKIKKITISDSVTSIDEDVFSSTMFYKDIANWENGVLYIGAYLIDVNDSFYGSYVIKDGTKVIADSAFYDTSLIRVTIPDSVTSIGDKAFCMCSSLRSITVDSANTSYSNDECGVLFNKDKTQLIQIPIGIIRTSYVIPSSVISIGDFALYGCNSILASIEIPYSVTSIGANAFMCCHSLTSITVDSANASYSSDEKGVLFNKNKTKLIQYPAGNTGTNYEIPDGVISIGDFAFYNCTKLTSITIPNSVTSIGADAFSFCGILTSITVDSANTAYSNDEYGVLFNKDKTKLLQYPDGNTRTNYVIPDSVTSISNDSFLWCHSLTSINVDSANTAYSSDEYGVLFNKNKTKLIRYPSRNTRTSYVIPDSVTSIGDYAFYFCDSLTSVTIPDSVTSIGDSAFSLCDSLTSVIIPDSVTSIGDSAFSSCDSLTSVTIGNSVTSIGDYAFRECDILTNVTIPDSVTDIGNYAFYYCPSLTSVTIPDSVISIWDYAFGDCKSLTDVYYTGTKDQWNNLSIGSYNEDLTSANITYNHIIPETVSLNSSSNEVVLSGGSGSSKTVYNAQEGYFYTVMAVKDKSASDLLSNENLLFIDQKTAESSTLTFDVVVPDSVTDYEIIITTNAPEEPEDEPSVPPTEPSTKPVEVPTTTKPTETEPSTKPVEVPATTKPAETEPSTKPVEVPTTTKPAETEPSTKPVEVPATTKPAETEPSTNPVEVPTTTKPAETEPSSKPVEVPTTTKPAETEPSTKPVEVPATTKPTETEPSTKPVEVPTTTKPAEIEPSTKPIVTVPVPSVEIRRPSQTEIKYGDSIILHADIDGDLPNGAKIVWTADNSNFTYTAFADGTTCTASPSANGDTVFTATVYDADGNEICSDTQTMTAKAGFFQKIIAFFKKIFGLTKVIPEAFKNF